MQYVHPPRSKIPQKPTRGLGALRIKGTLHRRWSYRHVPIFAIATIAQSVVSGNTRDSRLHGHTSRFPEIRDKVQKMFSLAPAVHERPITENTITVYRMGLIIITCAGMTVPFPPCWHLVCRHQLNLQAEMDQRRSGATLRGDVFHFEVPLSYELGFRRL